MLLFVLVALIMIWPGFLRATRLLLEVGESIFQEDKDRDW